MSVIFHQFYGPFARTTFALFFEFADGAFRLDWDPGPNYDEDKLKDDDISVFKFLPGTIAEITVSILSVPIPTGQILQFQGKQIRLFGVPASINAMKSAAAGDTPTVCFSPKCGGIPCPNPAEPLIKCPGNPPQPGCYRPEGFGASDKAE